MTTLAMRICIWLILLQRLYIGEYHHAPKFLLVSGITFAIAGIGLDVHWMRLYLSNFPAHKRAIAALVTKTKTKKYLQISKSVVFFSFLGWKACCWILGGSNDKAKKIIIKIKKEVLLFMVPPTNQAENFFPEAPEANPNSWKSHLAVRFT